VLLSNVTLKTFKIRNVEILVENDELTMRHLPVLKKIDFGYLFLEVGK